MIWPDLDPQFLSDSGKDHSIKKFMEDFYYDASTLNISYMTEADLDSRLEAGDATLYQDYYSSIATFRRNNFFFNHVRPIINTVRGHQERTRKSTVVVPQESSDQVTADQFSKIISWLYNNEQVDHTISEAFHGSLITGLNFLHVWMDFRDDPVSGSIKVSRKPYNAFIVDPFFRSMDLSDCRALWTRSYLANTEVMSLWPDHKEMISTLPYYALDGKFPFMAESFDAQYRNLMAYDEFYYRTYRAQKVIYDQVTGKKVEWREASDSGLRELLREAPNLKVVEQIIPTVNVAILANGKVLYDGANPLGIDEYPFVPVFSYYRSDVPYYPLRVQGLARSLRSPQMLYNHRMLVSLDYLESMRNSGWMFKEGALINPEDLFGTGNGSNLAVNADFSLDDVRKIAPQALDASWFQMNSLLDTEMLRTTGVNEELMGAADDSKAGVTEMLKQGASLTSLQSLFSQLDFAQKLLGKIVLKTIQVNFTAEKVARIIQEEPSPEFYNKDFGNYDCAIEDGFNTTTQRQQQFAQMVQLRNIGVQIPDEDMLEVATIQNKTEIMERIAQQRQQAQEAQQQQMQMQQQELQLRGQLMQANAHAQQAMGDERLSRINENQALAQERASKAHNEELTGLLNLVKAMKEIQNIDLSQLEKIIQLDALAKSTIEQPPVQPMQSAMAGLGAEAPQGVPMQGQNVS